MKSQLFDSFLNTTKNMDLTNVKPYTESELQPLYSNYWVENVIKKYLTLNPDNLEINNFINPSVIRSMLIMDLYDCSFSNNDELKENVFNWYVRLLSNFYTNDLFSLNTNIPNTVFNINDYRYFCDTLPINILLINILFEISYIKNQDIYADNTYEVLGPYKTKGNQVIIYRFHNILDLKTIDFYIYFDKNVIGKIDLFGHSTFQYINEEYTVILNDTDIESIFGYDNKEMLLNKLKEYKEQLLLNRHDDIYNNLKSRISRYQHLIWIDIDEIYTNIVNIPISNRITNTKELLTLIQF